MVINNVIVIDIAQALSSSSSWCGECAAKCHGAACTWPMMAALLACHSEEKRERAIDLLGNTLQTYQAAYSSLEMQHEAIKRR